MGEDGSGYLGSCGMFFEVIVIKELEDDNGICVRNGWSFGIPLSLQGF